MMGAIIGDIVGSRFEFHNHRSKDFEFFHKDCEFTDDTVMTLAVAKGILRGGTLVNGGLLYMGLEMKKLGRMYPNLSYGLRFADWLFSDVFAPYGSFGNGSAMRVSPCAWAAVDEKNCIKVADVSACFTHDHPEGVKGAEAIAIATYMALHGSTKDEIRTRMQTYYDIGFTLDQIRASYRFDETCQGTVPQAIVAFLEADSFEDAIRNAISIGGDSDTLAACTGAIAEAYFGIPQWMRETARTYLDNTLLEILDAFEAKYPPRICA